MSERKPDLLLPRASSPNNAHFEVTDADNVEYTLTVTLPLWRWRELAKQLMLSNPTCEIARPLKMTKIRPTCLRLEHNGRWGLVEFNGSEWRAEVAFYQKTGSRGPIVKPMSKRMPRYRRVGFFPTKREATDALCRVLDPRYHRAMEFAEANS
jgi:GNAT superfamily N-acetyltransferase